MKKPRSKAGPVGLKGNYMNEEQALRIAVAGAIIGIYPTVVLLAKYLIGKWCGNERCRDESLRYCVGYAIGRLRAASQRHRG